MIPPRIAPGGTIGIVTVATPAETRAAVERGAAWWEERGYGVKLGASTRERGGDFAGPPELRAADVQEMFADPEVAAIQTMRGGYGTMEVVPLLDYDAIASTPKPFVGLSDVTYLHVALGRLTGLATFYGPSLTLLGNRPVPPLTGDRLLEVLEGDGTGPVPYDPEGPYVRAIAGGSASGRIVGGCLPDLIHTIGTPWELETEGALLFFEVQGYGPTFIERTLIHLRQVGNSTAWRGSSSASCRTRNGVTESGRTGRANAPSTTSSTRGLPTSACPCSMGFQSGTAKRSPRSRSA